MIKTNKDLYGSKKNSKKIDKYEITTRSKKAEKQYYKILSQEVSKKLERLREDPRKELNAHPLKGKLKGLWSCHLSRNPEIVMVYEISDKNKEIIVYAVGSHQIYR